MMSPTAIGKMVCHFEVIDGICYVLSPIVEISSESPPVKAMIFTVVEKERGYVLRNYQSRDSTVMLSVHYRMGFVFASVILRFTERSGRRVAISGL